jgi:hypothetical protein
MRTYASFRKLRRRGAGGGCRVVWARLEELVAIAPGRVQFLVCPKIGQPACACFPVCRIVPCTIKPGGCPIRLISGAVHGDPTAAEQASGNQTSRRRVQERWGELTVLGDAGRIWLKSPGGVLNDSAPHPRPRRSRSPTSHHRRDVGVDAKASVVRCDESHKPAEIDSVCARPNRTAPWEESV